MKKIAIIAPCILPVPAVKGGAVEELITCILNQNEISKKYVIDLYTVACSSYNDISYSYTNIIPISQNIFTTKKDKLTDKFYRCLAGKLSATRGLDKQIVEAFIKHSKELDEDYYAVIIENQMSTAVELLKTLEQRDFPIYFHMHNDVDVYRSPEYIRFLVDNGVQFLAISGYIKSQILEHAGDAVIHILYNGIDLRKYDKHVSQNNGDAKFLYAGRIIPEKGVKELALAFNKMLSANPQSRASLDIIGFDGLDLSYEKNIRKIATKTNSINCVPRLSTEEMAKHYDDYDLVVMPTKNEEPFGLVALETIAKGMPLITTNSGALPEVVGDGAIIVEKNADLVSELAEAMTQLVDNPQHREELGKKAFNSARRVVEFSIDGYYDRLLEIISPQVDNPKVSIIVPVYNTADYLDKCVQSLINQTYKNLEIILVDDGSTDFSRELCKQYENQDSRIKVIFQDNQGVSVARNTGLEQTTGEYVFFIDSDDYIQLDTIEKLLEESMHYNADVVGFGFAHVFADGHEESFTEGVPSLWNGKTSVIKMMCEKNICTVPWNKFYRAGLWKDVRFPAGCLHEDEATIYKLLYDSKIVRFIPDNYYKYYQRSNSIMNAGLEGRYHFFIDAMQDRKEYFANLGESDLVQLSQISLLDWIKYVYRSIDNKQEKNKLIKLYKDEINITNAPSALGFKKKWALLLWKYYRY